VADSEPAGPASWPDLVSRILAVHEMCESLGIEHQFGGAIALSWYRNPRATTDIDLNITVSPESAAPVLAALRRLGVSAGQAQEALVARDGQARLEWSGRYLDVFFATLDFHRRIAEQSRPVSLASAEIPIMAPEHLIVCKAIFDRPKDWVDIEAMVTWGTPIDRDEVLRWIDAILGGRSETRLRIAALLAG
jgi:hypothetical protein